MYLGKYHGYKVYVYSGNRDNLDYFVYRDWILVKKNSRAHKYFYNLLR